MHRPLTAGRPAAEATTMQRNGTGHQASAGAMIRRSDHGQGTVVVSVAGELDLATAPTLKWALSDEVRAGATHLVLDLADVGFMDSTTIGVLVGIARSLDAERRLSLVAPRPELLVVFEVTGLERSFHIFPSLDAALGSFASPPGPPADQAQAS